MVQNLWWAAGYNIVAIPLAAGVLAPPGHPAVAGGRRGAHVAQHGHRRGQCAAAAAGPALTRRRPVWPNPTSRDNVLVIVVANRSDITAP